MAFRIFAYISPQALGDCVVLATFVSSIAALFDDPELYIYYRNNRPYKKHIVDCIRNARHVFAAATDEYRLPVELFDGTAGGVPFSLELTKSGIRRPHLILTHSMCRTGMLNSIPITNLAPPQIGRAHV